MKAPSTKFGTAAASVGIIGAGVAAGVGFAALKDRNQGLDPAVVQSDLMAGGIVGGLAAGFAGVVLSAVSADWRRVGNYAAIAGVGVPALLATVGLVKSLSARAPLNAKTVDVSTADSGKTIPLNVGDTLSVALPNTPNSGQDWFYQAPPAFLKSGPRTVSQVTGGLQETDPWQASGVGSAPLVAVLMPIDASGQPVQGAAPVATLTLNVVVTPGAVAGLGAQSHALPTKGNSLPIPTKAPPDPCRNCKPGVRA